MLPSGNGNPFLRETVGGMLAALAHRVGDHEAIVAPDRRITYAQFHREAQRVARGLLALGVKKNDKVALWLPTRPEWLFAQYGCAMIGAVVVALNTRYKAHELRYILRQSDATTLVCTDHSGRWTIWRRWSRCFRPSGNPCRASSWWRTSRCSVA